MTRGQSWNTFSLLFAILVLLFLIGVEFYTVYNTKSLRKVSNNILSSESHYDASLYASLLEDPENKVLCQGISVNVTDNGSDVQLLYQSEHSSQHFYSIVTFFASPDFVPALEVFLLSLASTNSSYPLIIAIPRNGCVDQNNLVQTALAILSKYPDLQYYLFSWKSILPPAKVIPRWSKNWSKLVCILPILLDFIMTEYLLFIEIVGDDSIQDDVIRRSRHCFHTKYRHSLHKLHCR